MEMRFFVRAHRKFGHMTAQRILGYLQAHLGAAASPFFPIKQLQVSDVGNKVCLPDSARIPSAGIVKIIRLRVKTISEDVVAIEYEIDVVNEVDHAWRGSHGKIAGRLGAVTVKCWCQEFNGGEKTEPSCHSKVCLGSLSFHTVVAPRPLTI